MLEERVDVDVLDRLLDPAQLRDRDRRPQRAEGVRLALRLDDPDLLVLDG